MPSTPCESPGLVSSLKRACPEESSTKAGKSSYGQILASTAWVGGSSIINIAIGIARTKVMALFLGPAGFGLAGLYMSVANMAQSVAGMGVSSSGVRQIAEAAGTQDQRRIAQTVMVLRYTSVILGLLGALLLIAFAEPISTLTFGNNQRVGGIYLLSVAVFLQLVSVGQGAFIQGMRRIADMAKMSTLGALFGTLIAIPLLYYFRMQGVVPSLVAVAAMSLVFSWRYSHKIPIEAPSFVASEIGQEAFALLKLGFAFMASNLLMMGSAYVIRIIIMRKLGLEATGLYQSAWTLGGLYVGMILQAMGTDFYPRLTAVINNHSQCNRLVNEQTRISLLMAGPGVIGTLTLAPLVIAIFYAAKFSGAVDVLRWICLGIAMRVISWPLGYIIMARGRQNVIILCELAWTSVHLGLAWICVGRFGLAGAGIAFFGSYVFHIVLTYLVVRRMSSFSWSTENKSTMLQYLAIIAVVFAGFYFMPRYWALGLGLLLAVLATIYSIRVLIDLTADGVTSERIRRVLAKVNLLRSRPAAT